jgi:hypothetical protein
MTPGLAYLLGIVTPFAALTVWAIWDWGIEGLSEWWRRKRPTLGRLRCFLFGHAYGGDDRWVVCRRCGHAYLAKERSR